MAEAEEIRRWTTHGHVSIFPDDFFSQALPESNSKSVIVFFYADWCGPCRAIEPVMAELARDYVGKVVFYQMTVDEPDKGKVTEKYGIQAVPTILFLRNGQEVERIIGAVSRSLLENAIKRKLL